MPFKRKIVDRIIDDLMNLEDEIVLASEKAIIQGVIEIGEEIKRSLSGLETDGSGKILDTSENFITAQNIIIAAAPALQALAEEGKNLILGRIGGLTTDLVGVLDAAGFGIIENPIARLDQNVIGALLDVDLSKFNGGAVATTQQLATGIFGMITGQNTFDDMVLALESITIGQKDRAGNPLSRHASTWAMSAVISYEGEFMQNLIPDEETGGFYYSGPKDAANRPFCNIRAGKVFTKEKIAKDVANNPIGGASLRLPGGFNCRHVLVPVPIEDDILEGEIAEQGADVPDEKEPVIA